MAEFDGQALPMQLQAEFAAAQSARKMMELRWLNDLRQYRGIYDPATAARLSKRKRSKVFYRLTTAKVNTMTGRLMDLLFPQKSVDWSLSPTPDPMLPEDVLKEALADEYMPRAQELLQAQLQRLAQAGIQPDELAIQNLGLAEQEEIFGQANTSGARIMVARERVNPMERVIDDQLNEESANGQRRPGWQQNCRSVGKSVCLYGMGILKGPFVERVETRRFMLAKKDDSQIAWNEELFAVTLKPYHEAVPYGTYFRIRTRPDHRNCGMCGSCT